MQWLARVLRRLLSHATRVFEEMGRHSSKDESADVCQVSHTAGLYLRDSASVYQLHEEPDTDQERGRYERNPRENEDKKNCFNLIARVGHDERAHDSCDRTTCT